MSMLRREIRSGAIASLVTNGVILPIAAGGASAGIVLGEHLKGGEIAAIVFGYLVAVINVLLIVAAAKNRSKPDRAPAASYLTAATGRTLDQVSSSLEEELAAMPNGPIFSGVRLLPSFLYKRGSYGPTVIPIDDIAWIYKKVTTRRVNFVPVSKSYSVVVHTTQGPHAVTGFQFMASAQIVDEFLARLAVRIPWAIIGYNDGFASRWRIARKEIVANMRQRQQAARAAAAPTGNIAAG